MNGSRLNETLGADIDELDVDRRLRSLQIARRGGKLPILLGPVLRMVNGQYF
jgi:hypothetical protein